MDQAGGGAAHRAGVGDGLRRRKDSVQGRTTAWERRRQEVKKGKLFYQICIMGTYVGIHERPEGLLADDIPLGSNSRTM